MSSSARFNPVVLEDAIHRELGGQVKGYTVVIANEDGIQAKVSGGWAQAPGDGNVPMKTYIYNNIGSVSKVLSGIALLHLFNEHQLVDVTVQEQLDMFIWRKLPPKWHPLIPPENKKVTYRHLLQHKSGIPNTDPPSGSPYAGLKVFYMITQKPAVGHTRVYSNFHFAILTDLIPAIAYPAEYNRCHQEFNDLEIFEYSQKMRQATGELFARYMREVIFPLSLGEIKPSCDPEQDLPNDKIAKIYDSSSDASGWIWSEKESNGSCRGQGGYYMTAQDLANFARTFAFTDRYIGPTTRASLYKPSATGADDERLIYSETIDHPGFGQELNQLHWPWKCGEQGGARAALVRLPYDYFGVGFVNSEGKGCGGIARAVIDGFYAATRGEPITLYKHGLSLASFDEIVDTLAEYGSMPVWKDLYTVNGELYVNAIFRPANDRVWVSRTNLSAAEYQTMWDEFKPQGFRPVHVQSYQSQDNIRYSLILQKDSGPDYEARHGQTGAEFRQTQDELRAQGYALANVSAVESGGQRLYTSLYFKEPGVVWEVRGFLPIDEFEAFLQENEAAGRVPTYIRAYQFQGQSFYSVICKGVPRQYAYVFGSGPIRYQETMEKRLQEGYHLKAITGYAAGNEHRYAAIWLKASQ
jgi:CubicO group peptidase (beta-lactamase class C family)